MLSAKLLVWTFFENSFQQAFLVLHHFLKENLKFLKGEDSDLDSNFF